eukprot:363862-Chlamydomonas_euryale.AAC.5
MAGQGRHEYALVERSKQARSVIKKREAGMGSLPAELLRLSASPRLMPATQSRPDFTFSFSV